MIARIKMVWRVLRGEVCPAPFFLPTIEIPPEGAIVETRRLGWVNFKVRGR